jgi:hypothetical protein
MSALAGRFAALGLANALQDKLIAEVLVVDFDL